MAPDVPFKVKIRRLEPVIRKLAQAYEIQDYEKRECRRRDKLAQRREYHRLREVEQPHDGEAGSSRWAGQTDAIDDPSALEDLLPHEDEDEPSRWVDTDTIDDPLELADIVQCAFALGLWDEDTPEGLLVSLGPVFASDEPTWAERTFFDPRRHSDTRFGLFSRFLHFLNSSIQSYLLPVGFVYCLILCGIYAKEIWTAQGPNSFKKDGFSILSAFVVWLPSCLCWIVLMATISRIKSSKPWDGGAWFLTIICSIIFASITIPYCFGSLWTINTMRSEGSSHNEAFLSYTFCRVLQRWSTGPMPHIPEVCASRVELHQAPLFKELELYGTQFARVYPQDGWVCHIEGLEEAANFTIPGVCCKGFDPEPMQKLQDNETLCSQGFQGNMDLYGLGIRCGVYLQWMASLLANNFLPSRRQDSQRISLLFSLAICLATVITSFTGSCVFGIEIEILYWIYWGGFFCVFASAPCPIRLGQHARTTWIQVDWTTATLFLTHWIMAYHGIWYVWKGYDQVFARMPCGTYHVFPGFVLQDPSDAFFVLRDWFGLLAYSLFPAVMGLFPWAVLLLTPELRHSIQASFISQTLLGFLGWKQLSSTSDEPSDGIETQDEDPGNFRLEAARVPHDGDFMWVDKIDDSWSLGKRAWSMFRMVLALPVQARRGLYLVTAADLKKRWLLRCQWAVMGLASWIFSVAAIEILLSWNKVQGVYSLDSTGQYIPLIIATGSFGDVCWSLVKQEMERRRAATCHRNADDAVDDVELSNLSGLSNAISHAFAQPDEEFLNNGGIFPGD